ncbi:MAG: ABC transporter ATP-binding protein, partial [Clostridia bacterium]|nr:ABC transporter ATP-binding protein [Clostridia bacterium]
GGIGFLFWLDPIFASILLVSGLLFMVVFQVFSRLYKRLHRECQESEGRSRSYMQECIENLIVVKSFTNEAGVLAKLREYLIANYRKLIRRNVYAGIGNSGVHFGFMFAYYLAMAWGILQLAGVFNDGEPTMLVGTFVVVLQIMEQIRSPFRNASGLLPQYYSMLASAERLQEFSELPAEERSVLTTPLSKIYNDLCSIRLDRVTFSYGTTPVFKDYSLELEKGKLTAIIGASGSGKTTLIKLLLGLVYPQKGAVVLSTNEDEIDIDAATRGLFAYVPQGNMLLSGTIEENIRFGNHDVSNEDIHRAVSLSCLDELIASLEKGIKTRVGERGVGLSEGQIQRVAIARALLSKAPILLLDECTSALDVQTEERLIENLKTMTDRTVIFISHREAVLKRADEIVKIEKFQQSLKKKHGRHIIVFRVFLSLKSCRVFIVFAYIFGELFVVGDVIGRSVFYKTI